MAAFVRIPLAAQLLACWPGAQPSSSAQAHAGGAHVTDPRCRIAQNGSHARAARIVGTNRWRRREAAEASYVITSRRHPYGIHVRRRDKTGMIQPFRGLTCPSSAPKISATRTSSSAGRLMPREQPCHLPPRIAGRDCTVRAPSRDSSWTVTILAAIFGRVISTG